MSVVLCYVDVSDYSLQEDFIRFVHCEEGLSGQALSKVLLKSLNEMGLDIKDCRGQCYDGAGNVAGKINGCSAHILRVNHLCIYMHCSAHKLNLVIVHSCSVYNIRKTMDEIKQITYFFNFSETRLKVLERNIKELCEDTKSTKLYDVARTRWVERIIGMGNFQDLFEAILATFEEMALNLENKINRDTVSKATSHRNALERFDFIVSMVITRQVFDLTMDVTKLLQSRTNDILKTIILIDCLKDQFSNIRSNIEKYHGEWFQTAKLLAERVNVIVSVPRTAKKQVHRPNHPSENVSEFYKRSVTIPLIDHVIAELDQRFDNSLTVYHGLVIVPSRLLHLISQEEKREKKPVMTWRSQFDTFFNFYANDFPNPLAINGELEVWVRFWQKYQAKHDSLPDSVEATLKAMPHGKGIFDNIDIALRILATVPVTSCECERSFSSMKRLKNYARSTMKEDRLVGHSLLHVHLDMNVEKEEVVNTFAAMGNRRLDFI
jgi:hypothetical protein